jgi:pyruvate-formate lyase-activating enzyme
VHPTRRCNLQCLHCYSSSGPRVTETLAIGVLAPAVEEAARLGYSVLGVSGGEPLLYPELARLLDAAHAAGMTTTVTTNGTLLRAEAIEVLAARADLVAVSIDGKPASHDEMRASPTAFARLLEGLPRLRASGVPFGFIFTLTMHNVHELDWIAEFAADQGASLLQVHPLESVGRASKRLEGSVPDETENLAAVLETERIRVAFAGRLAVQLDLAPRETIRALPERVFADEQPPHGLFADLLSPLVIETSGVLSPLLYGFDRRYSIGRLGDAPLASLTAAWTQNTYPEFRALCRRAYDRIVAADTSVIVNWYEIVADEARRTASVAACPV